MESTQIGSSLKVWIGTSVVFTSLFAGGVYTGTRLQEGQGDSARISPQSQERIWDENESLRTRNAILHQALERCRERGNYSPRPEVRRLADLLEFE